MDLRINALAASATLHCLTGCAIGEILGLMIGTAAGLTNGVTIAISVALAFVFGFGLSMLPLLGAGVAAGAALRVVFAADALSIATMEVVDNAVMAVIPGAMGSGLVNPIFWLSLMLALAVAYVAAYPVNRYLLERGKGHALTHAFHEGHDGHTEPTGHPAKRRYAVDTVTLAVALAAFMIGGLVVSIADTL